ncbi:MAG: DUF5403 family protein [Nocardioides sp.]
MAHLIASLPGVQGEVDDETDQLVHRASQLLRQHVDTGVAHIEKTRGDIDGYAVLVDSNVTNIEGGDNNSALSIEFGRAGFVDPETGNTWGQMDGLGVLSRAAKLAAKGRRIPRLKARARKVRTKRSKKPERK